MKFKSKEQQAAVMAKYPKKKGSSSSRTTDAYDGYEGRNHQLYKNRKSVRAIVKRGDKYLLVQRAADGSFPNFWEFPGGKAETSDLKADVIREVQEETALKIKNPKFRRRIMDNVTKAKNYYYVVESKSGKIRVNDHENQKVGWFTAYEMQQLHMTPVTKKVYAEMFYHQDVNQKKFIFGDFDRDKIRNIDDPRPYNPEQRKHPEIDKNPKHFHKSNYSDNESKLSNALLNVKLDNELHRESMSKIEKQYPPDKKRIKSVASTINKLQRKDIQRRESNERIGHLTDKAGMIVYADDYEDVEKKVKEIKSDFKTVRSDEDNHYKKSWKSGRNYFAHHLIVKVDGKPVEVQIKTKKQAKLQDKMHRLYKSGKMTEKQQKFYYERTRKLAIQEGYTP